MFRLIEQATIYSCQSMITLLRRLIAKAYTTSKLKALSQQKGE